MTRVVEDCKLTGRKAAPIIHRSFRVVRFLMIVREEPRVLYISAAIESQEETRTRFPKAHEHEKRASGPGSSTRKGTGPVDGLARCRRALSMFFCASAGDISLPWDRISLSEAIPTQTLEGRRAAVGRSFRDVETAKREQHFLTGQPGH